MKNFEYFNPTKIIFGEGEISKLDALVPQDAHVLVLYGGGSAQKTGTLDEVKRALKKRSYLEFGGIEANPQFSTLIKAVKIVQEQKIDFLLAVGGGSVIDGTKFIAAAALFEGDPWEILLKMGKNITKALPLGTVLTIPATGSEMNCGSVITRSEMNAKLAFLNPLVFPVFSILDPAKTLTLPLRQVANGIVDAFVHIAEQYITTCTDSKVQDKYAESLLQILFEEGPKVMLNPQDMAARKNIMWVATMALNGLIGVGVDQDWATHAIGHEITALYNIDHARTLAIVMGGLWSVCKKNKAQKLLQYGERVLGICLGNDDERIDQIIKQTDAFFESLGVKTRFKDYDLDESDVQRIIEHLKKHGMVKLGEHADITPEVSYQILMERL